MSAKTIKINRAPVLTLWAAIVAERLGFKRDEALTLGRAVAGLNAYAKGVSLGLFQPTPAAIREERRKLARGRLKVSIMHRAVPVVRTPDGLRAISGGRPIKPDSVQNYLDGKFGDALGPVRTAMRSLARSLTPRELSARAYPLYVQFRPVVPKGVPGMGCGRQARSGGESEPSRNIRNAEVATSWPVCPIGLPVRRANMCTVE